MIIRAIDEQDRSWVRKFLQERWGAPEVVSRGHLHQAGQLPGYIAIKGEHAVGLVTYSFANGDCEIVTLDSLESSKGIGSALIAAVLDVAKAQGCRRVQLITTNDNTAALRFYQKVGFVLVAVHREAIRKSRELKPTIPDIGLDGIPIRDEIELEIRLLP